MKKVIFASILLIAAFKIKSQCIVNGNFALYNTPSCQPTDNQYPNCIDLGGCRYFADNIVINWRRAHGTPYLFLDNTNSDNNYVQMWGNFANTWGGEYGEGILGGYNFIKGIPYTISVRSNLSQTGILTGARYRIYAVTGMPPANNNSPFCGQILPVPATKEEVPTAPIPANTVNQGWVTRDYLFTPHANFTNVWVYPSTSTTPSNQCFLNLDYIFICVDSCNGVVNYNTGQAPSGRSKFRIINAGSSTGTGGSGTVTVATNSSTQFVGVETVEIKNDFDASVTNTGSFEAFITNCIPSSLTRPFIQPSLFENTPQVIADKTGLEIQASDVPPENKIKVYPNPATDKVRVYADFIMNKNVTIEIKDQNGRLIYKSKKYIKQKQTSLSVETGHLKSGMYNISLVTDNQTYTTLLFIENKF